MRKIGSARALSIRRPTPLVCAKSRIGRIQRRVRRLLIVHGEMTTPQLRQAIYGSPTKHWHYRPVGDAARKFAVEVGRRSRHGMRGRPGILWRLK
jgi:hypothetical protein